MSLEDFKSKFGGTWVLDRSENFDDYLKAMGIGFVMRKMAGSSTPTCIITVEDDHIRILTKAVKNQDVRFRLGEEITLEGPMGNASKTTFQYENGVLIADIKPVDKNKTAQVVERDVINGELVMTMRLGDTVCRRIFKRQA